MPPKNPTSDDSSLDLGDAQEPSVKIDLREDDDDAEGQQEEAAGGERPVAGERPRDQEGKWTRQKRERGQSKKEEAGWRVEKAQLEGRLAEMAANSERQVAALRAEMSQSAGGRREQGGGQAASPFEAQFAELDAALASELQLIERDSTRDYRRYNALRRKETALVAKQALWESQQGQPQQGQRQESSPYAARFEIMRSEFPWLGDARYSALIDKTRNMRNYLINVEGMPDTIDTDRQAAAQVIAKFGAEHGLRSPAAPSERTRALYAGPRQGNGPRRSEQAEEGEIEIPRALAAASGLSSAALRAALREK